MRGKSSILILTDWFAPGYKAGGPIRSCLNLARALKDHFRVHVLTTDTDFKALAPYPGITSNQWTDFEPGIQVNYLSDSSLNRYQIFQEIQALSPDIVYLNSMFSIPFTIWPLWMKRTHRYRGKVILAPRGMLHAGAMQYKTLKKRAFINVLKWLGIHKLIKFHATDGQEKQDINYFFGLKASIRVLPNLPNLTLPPFRQVQKKPGEVKWVYISRIGPKKNLLFFLELLRKSRKKGKIQFDIIGPIEDPIYWKKCQKIIESLPIHITVSLIGELPPQSIAERLWTYHFFVLPTWGENFGHAIFEAFVAGKPVLISDQTPWHDLRDRLLGWALPLDEPESFLKAIDEALVMDTSTYHRWSEHTRQFACDYIRQTDWVEGYSTLFCS